ncbi:MAG: HIT family protein [Desulfomonilaceae bacterium]
MDRIWAPWRIDYIVGGERESGCIFCSKPASDEDDKNLIVHKARGAFTMMNKFPYNNGHVLVAPYKHASDICELQSEELRLLMEEVCRAMGVIRNVMHAEGFNIGINIGAVAGAGFEEHVHYHIVPRWNGDTNIMPVLADVKIIPEHLLSTCRKLRDEFMILYPESTNEVEE